jgi:hypothetical protein
MVDKDHLQGKSVIVRIDGIGKAIQATVTYVESDGFWFSSQQLAAELGQAGLPDGMKAPTVFVPTSRLVWLIAERD